MTLSTTRRAVAWLTGLASLACATAPSDREGQPSDAVVVAELGGDAKSDLEGVQVRGSGVRSVTRTGNTLTIRADPARTRDLEIRAQGACPLNVSATALAPGKALRVALTPLLSFGPDLPQVGYGESFSVAATPNCAEAPKSVSWQQQDGPALDDVRRGALTFAARMPGAVSVLGHDPAWGIVPISARTRTQIALAATWKGASGEAGRRMITVSAAARARGLPNVTLGTRLYLGGRGWHVASRPPGSRSEVQDVPERDRNALPSFIPDARGAFVLEDGERHGLRLVAGKYDETPLDCGRSECHKAITETSRSSPMQTIFARGIGAQFGDDYPGCALGCHTAGEPGLDDGGFAAIAALLGRSPKSLSRGGYHDMPSALRRVSGVNCLACHGPGTVPEPQGRWALLRTDVCATCHDAPPRYGHVAAFQTSKMSHADADPRTRDGACARCHTTWGFLDQPGRRPPAHAGPTGIGCAACHAVHPEHREPNATAVGRVCAAALPRDVAVPALLEGRVPDAAAKSRVCLPCHTPDGDGGPAASSAAIWLGRGGLDPETGAALDGDRPHAAVQGGCIGCHRGGPDGLGKGVSHGFRSDEAACAACHAPKNDDGSVRQRAQALFERFRGATAEREPAHATPERLDLASRRGRALHDVLLVLEDRGAVAHNAPYARRLLDAAELALEKHEK